MAISKFNSEGYYDPVVYEALTKVEAEERAARAAAAYRPLVYICSPYAGDIEKNTYREAIDKFLKNVYEPSAMEGRYDYIPADSSAGVIIIWIPLREGISSMVPVRLILEKRVPSDVHRYAIWKFGVNALAKSAPI